MSRIVNDCAGALAAARLLDHDQSIYAAFDSLRLGFDHDDVIEYLGPAYDGIELPEAHRGHVAGLVMGFALVVAEAARVRREFGPTEHGKPWEDADGALHLYTCGGEHCDGCAGGPDR